MKFNKVIFGYIPKNEVAKSSILDYLEEYEGFIYTDGTIGIKVNIELSNYNNIFILTQKELSKLVDRNLVIKLKKQFNNLPKRISKHFLQKPDFFLIMEN